MCTHAHRAGQGRAGQSMCACECGCVCVCVSSYLPKRTVMIVSQPSSHLSSTILVWTKYIWLEIWLKLERNGNTNNTQCGGGGARVLSRVHFPILAPHKSYFEWMANVEDFCPIKFLMWIEIRLVKMEWKTKDIWRRILFFFPLWKMSSMNGLNYFSRWSQRIEEEASFQDG